MPFFFRLSDHAQADESTTSLNLITHKVERGALIKRSESGGEVIPWSSEHRKVRYCTRPITNWNVF